MPCDSPGKWRIFPHEFDKTNTQGVCIVSPLRRAVGVVAPHLFTRPQRVVVCLCVCVFGKRERKIWGRRKAKTTLGT